MATNAMHSHLEERKGKRKEHSIYVAPFCMHTHKALRHWSHSFTCKQHHACLSFVSVHQTAPPQLRRQTSNCSLLLIYQPRKDERLSWPGWLTYSRWFTHKSGHPSATGSAQDKESSPAKDRHSTVVPCDQPKKILEFSSTAPSPYHHIWLVTFMQSSSIW